jgi:DNA replication protein DnaC
MINQTMEQMKKMNLYAMEAEYRRQTELPVMVELPFDERVSMLTDAEWNARENRRLRRALKQANLREKAAGLEDVDFDPLRKLDRATIARLSDCAWIRGNWNLFLTGACGTGKTWLSCAYGNAAVRQGYTVRSYRTSSLLSCLAIAHSDGSIYKLINELKKPDLLILDDFGTTRFDVQRCRDVDEIIDGRYQKGAVLITAQLPVSEWHGVFEDATIADAVLDRILHNSFRIELHGPSRRRIKANDLGNAQN